MHVGIIGCGTAGQATAILLARQGHHVSIFERSPTLGAAGAGLLIQPSGLDILERLNLRSQIETLASPIHRLIGQTTAGRTILDLPYSPPSLQPHTPPLPHGLGLHRGALFNTLQHAVESLNIPVTLDFDALAIVPDGPRRRIRSRSGELSQPFDLVCIADGSRSSLRASLDIPHRASTYSWGALWFVADVDPGQYPPELRQVYRGTRSMLGFLPTSRIHPHSPQTLSLFWSIRLADADALFAAGLDRWKARLRALTHRLDPILDQISDIRQLILAPYQDVVMQRLYDGPVVLLGDAAHAMSPQLGQGANLALVDAWVLSACIADALDARQPVPLACARYSALRRRHLRFYQYASRWLTPLYQSRLEFITPFRDLLSRPIASIPWVRRQMLESLCGWKSGVFSSCRDAIEYAFPARWPMTDSAPPAPASQDSPSPGATYP